MYLPEMRVDMHLYVSLIYAAGRDSLPTIHAKNSARTFQLFPESSALFVIEQIWQPGMAQFRPFYRVILR